MKFLNIYKRNENTNVRKFSNEYYIICAHKTFKINEIGAVILKYVGSEISISELANRILSKYEGAKYDEIYKDIENFLLFLISENIIMDVKDEI